MSLQAYGSRLYVKVLGRDVAECFTATQSPGAKLQQASLAGVTPHHLHPDLNEIRGVPTGLGRPYRGVPTSQRRCSV